MDDLDQARRRMQSEHEAEVERLKADHETRLAAINQALEALGGSRPMGPTPDAPSPMTPGISAQKLGLLRTFLKESGPVRQADIPKGVKSQSGVVLNSGTISIGLRILQASGEVRPLNKEKGSQLWESTGMMSETPPEEERQPDWVPDWARHHNQ